MPGDPVERAGVAWFVVRPNVNGASVSASTRVVRQGYLAANGEYLLYPHVNMTNDGSMAMTFSMGGPGTFLSAAWSAAKPGGRFTAIHIAAAGAFPDNGFTATPSYGGAGRWGDYSNGELIPGTNRVWLATNYIPNSGDGNANWGNWIFEVVTS